MVRVDQNDMDELLNFSGDETDIESMGGLSRQVSRDSSVSNSDLRMTTGNKYSTDEADVPRRNDISRGEEKAIYFAELGTYFEPILIPCIVAKDLAMYGKSCEMDQRRHSVSVCETPMKIRTNNPRRQKLFIKSDSRSSTSLSSSNTTTPSSSGRATPIFGAQTNGTLAAPLEEESFLSPSYGLNTAQMHANLQSEFLQSVSPQLSDKASRTKGTIDKKPVRIKSLRQPKIQVKPLKHPSKTPSSLSRSAPKTSSTLSSGKRQLGEKVTIPSLQKKPIIEVKPKAPIVAKPVTRLKNDPPHGSRNPNTICKKDLAQEKIEDVVIVDKPPRTKRKLSLKERLLAQRGVETDEIIPFETPCPKTGEKELAFVQATMLIKQLERGQSSRSESSNADQKPTENLIPLTRSTSLDGLVSKEIARDPVLQQSESLACVKTKLFQNLQSSSKNKCNKGSNSSLVLTTTFETIPEAAEEDSSESGRCLLNKASGDETRNSSNCTSEETLIGTPIESLNNPIELCILNERLKGLLKSLVPSWSDNYEPGCTIKQWTEVRVIEHCILGDLAREILTLNLPLSRLDNEVYNF